MPYVLTQAANVMAIDECEFGTAGTIQFTKFTSCIGILAKVTGANQVIGIHLVLINTAGDQFSMADVLHVQQRLTALNYDNTTCMIIGQVAVWERSNQQAYNALVAGLNNPKIYPFGDGVYGATISGGAIEITY